MKDKEIKTMMDKLMEMKVGDVLDNLIEIREEADENNTSR